MNQEILNGPATIFFYVEEENKGYTIADRPNVPYNAAEPITDFIVQHAQVQALFSIPGASELFENATGAQPFPVDENEETHLFFDNATKTLTITQGTSRLVTDISESGAIVRIEITRDINIQLAVILEPFGSCTRPPCPTALLSLQRYMSPI